MAKPSYFAVNLFPVFAHKASIWLLVRVIGRSDTWRARMHCVWNQVLQESQQIVCVSMFLIYDRQVGFFPKSCVSKIIYCITYYVNVWGSALHILGL